MPRDTVADPLDGLPDGLRVRAALTGDTFRGRPVWIISTVDNQGHTIAGPVLTVAPQGVVPAMTSPFPSLAALAAE